jgi:hypothetical protein
MFMQLGLNVSDEACFYTQNMKVHKVYDIDSMALPNATFPDSIVISLMLDMGEKVSFMTLRRASRTFVLFFVLKCLPATESSWCTG